MSLPEPISPELALVAPDVADAARAALPDRPWEAFAPPRPVPRLRLAPSPGPEPAPATAVVPGAPRRRRLVTSGRLLTAAAVVLLATSFLPNRNAPRLVAEAAPAPPRRAFFATGPLPATAPTAACSPAGAPRDPFLPACQDSARRPGAGRTADR
jgi:hypothetical protein